MAKKSKKRSKQRSKTKQSKSSNSYNGTNNKLTSFQFELGKKSRSHDLIWHSNQISTCSGDWPLCHNRDLLHDAWLSCEPSKVVAALNKFPGIRASRLVNIARRTSCPRCRMTLCSRIHEVFSEENTLKTILSNDDILSSMTIDPLTGSDPPEYILNPPKRQIHQWLDALFEKQCPIKNFQPSIYQYLSVSPLAKIPNSWSPELNGSPSKQSATNGNLGDIHRHGYAILTALHASVKQAVHTATGAAAALGSSQQELAINALLSRGSLGRSKPIPPDFKGAHSQLLLAHDHIAQVIRDSSNFVRDLRDLAAHARETLIHEVVQKHEMSSDPEYGINFTENSLSWIPTTVMSRAKRIYRQRCSLLEGSLTQEAEANGMDPKARLQQLAATVSAQNSSSLKCTTSNASINEDTQLQMRDATAVRANIRSTFGGNVETFAQACVRLEASSRPYTKQNIANDNSCVSATAQGEETQASLNRLDTVLEDCNAVCGVLEHVADSVFAAVLRLRQLCYEVSKRVGEQNLESAERYGIVEYATGPQEYFSSAHGLRPGQFLKPDSLKLHTGPLTPSQSSLGDSACSVAASDEEPGKIHCSSCDVHIDPILHARRITSLAAENLLKYCPEAYNVIEEVNRSWEISSARSQARLLASIVKNGLEPLCDALNQHTSVGSLAQTILHLFSNNISASLQTAHIDDSNVPTHLRFDRSELVQAVQHCWTTSASDIVNIASNASEGVLMSTATQLDKASEPEESPARSETNGLFKGLTIRPPTASGPNEHLREISSLLGYCHRQLVQSSSNTHAAVALPMRFNMTNISTDKVTEFLQNDASRMSSDPSQSIREFTKFVRVSGISSMKKGNGSMIPHQALALRILESCVKRWFFMACLAQRIVFGTWRAFVISAPHTDIEDTVWQAGLQRLEILMTNDLQPNSKILDYFHQISSASEVLLNSEYGKEDNKNVRFGSSLNNLQKLSMQKAIGQSLTNSRSDINTWTQAFATQQYVFRKEHHVWHRIYNIMLDIITELDAKTEAVLQLLHGIKTLLHSFQQRQHVFCSADQTSFVAHIECLCHEALLEQMESIDELFGSSSEETKGTSNTPVQKPDIEILSDSSSVLTQSESRSVADPDIEVSIDTPAVEEEITTNLQTTIDDKESPQDDEAERLRASLALKGQTNVAVVEGYTQPDSSKVNLTDEDDQEWVTVATSKTKKVPKSSTSKSKSRKRGGRKAKAQEKRAASENETRSDSGSKSTMRHFPAPEPTEVRRANWRTPPTKPSLGFPRIAVPVTGAVNSTWETTNAQRMASSVNSTTPTSAMSGMAPNPANSITHTELAVHASSRGTTDSLTVVGSTSNTNSTNATSFVTHGSSAANTSTSPSNVANTKGMLCEKAKADPSVPHCEQLDREIKHLRSAFQTVVANGDAKTAQSIVSALSDVVAVAVAAVPSKHQPATINNNPTSASSASNTREENHASQSVKQIDSATNQKNVSAATESASHTVDSESSLRQQPTEGPPNVLRMRHSSSSTGTVGYGFGSTLIGTDSKLNMIASGYNYPTKLMSVTSKKQHTPNGLPVWVRDR